MTRPEFRDSKSPLTARSAGLDLFWPSPLESVPRTGVDYAALVKTTPKAWLQKTASPYRPTRRAVRRRGGLHDGTVRAGIRIEQMDSGAYELGVKFQNVYLDDLEALVKFLEANAPPPSN